MIFDLDNLDTGAEKTQEGPVKTKREFEPIPDAEYNAEIFEVQDRHFNGIDYMSITFKIMGGDFDSRRIWKNIYPEGKTPESTMKIKRMLKAMLYGLGAEGIKSSQELAKKVVGMQVVIRVSQNKYTDIIRLWEGF